MACCGQKREGMAAEVRSARFNRPTGGLQGQAMNAQASNGQSGERTVTLMYKPRSAVAVVGPTTKTRYQFSGGGSLQAVDRRDAEAMVASGMFERVWG